jgi:RNA polymerase sigma-70 factor (ECF subfamily)
MAQAITWTPAGTRQPEWDLNVVRPEAAAAADPSFSDLGEAALVAACLGGQNGAFDVIVERHRRAVYQLCYRFVGNHEDASDLSQEVFLRAYRGLRNFRGRSSLGTWLYRIGVNVCLNRVSVKKPQSEPIEAQQHVDTRTESPSEQLMSAERAARVRAAIAKLPRKQRAVLILRMYQEMSHQEIAKVVGSSVGAVKANVFHALQNLKKLLAGENV